MRSGSVEELMQLRGEAINAYAGIEEALCELMSLLGEMPPESAREIFYRMTAHPRSEVLGRLGKSRFKDAKVWNSAIDRVGKLTGTRNKIVHRHMRQSVQVGGDGPQAFRELYEARDPSRTPIRADELRTFIANAESLATELRQFLADLRREPSTA